MVHDDEIAIIDKLCRATDKDWGKSWFPLLIVTATTITFNLIAFFIVQWLYRLMFPIIGVLIILGLGYLTIVIVDDEWNGVIAIIIGLFLIGIGITFYFLSDLIINSLPVEFPLLGDTVTWYPMVNLISLWVIAGLFGLSGLIDLILGIVAIVKDRKYAAPSYVGSSSSSTASTSTSRLGSSTASTSTSRLGSSTTSTGISGSQKIEDKPSEGFIKGDSGYIPLPDGDPDEYREAMDDFRQERGLDAPKKREKKGPFEDME